MEYRFTPRWSVQAEYGIPFRALKLGTWNRNLRNYHYSKWRLEGRRYFAFNKSSLSGRLPFFIAAEGFFINQRYGKNNDYYHDWQNNSIYDFDSAGIRRSVTGFCFKIGSQKYFKEDGRFFIEWAFGLGVRYIKVNYPNLVNARLSTNRKFEEWGIGAGDRFIGKETTPHLAINFRVANNLK